MSQTRIEYVYDRMLQDMLPRYYGDYRESEEFLLSSDVEFELMYNSLSDLANNFFILNSSWALEYYEKIFGLDFYDGTDQERISRILSKLRGHGTVNVDLLKRVAESWYGGEVEVEEVNSKYLIKIKYISTTGVPTDLEMIDKQLKEIIPAHIAIEYLFSYLLIKDIHKVLTLKEMENLTLDNFAGGRK